MGAKKRRDSELESILNKRSSKGFLKEFEKFEKDWFQNYRSIICSPIPLVITGKDRKKIIEVSNGALELFGYTRDEMIGMAATDFYPDPKVRKRITRRLERGEPVVNEEVQLKTKSRGLIWIELQISFIKDYDGNIIGTLGAPRDISEKKMLEGRATNNLLSVIQTHYDILEVRNKWIKGHSERVADLSIKIIEALKNKENKDKETKELIDFYSRERSTLETYMRLHDIGKTEITPREILDSKDVFEKSVNPIAIHASEGDEVMKLHLKKFKYQYDPFLRAVIRWHHEWYNGKGYPDGLKRNEIPLIARIVAVADAWDAMRSDRPYRSALKIEKALDELKTNAGTQFDPHIVNIFINKVLKVA